MVPAGIVEITEMLGDLVLLNTPAAQTNYPAPFPTTSHMVPEPMLVELVNNFHKDIQNQYLGSTDDDIDMLSVAEAMIETPDYSIPTTWTSQPEHQIFYSQVGQPEVANNINQRYQTYTRPMHNHENWASMVSIPSSVALLVNQIETVCQFQPMQNESISHMNQPQVNHPVDPLAAAISKSPTTVPVIIESPPTQGDKRPDEPRITTKPHIPICLDSHPGGRQNRACIIRPNPGHRHWEKRPVRLDMDLVANLVRSFYVFTALS